MNFGRSGSVMLAGCRTSLDTVKMDHMVGTRSDDLGRSPARSNGSERQIAVRES
jgi:hypothetical protein